MAAVGGRQGVLVLHGLTGSPWEVRPLGERFAADGYTVAMPLLAGHGVSVQELGRSRWRDWLSSARQGLTWLEGRCDRVHLVGLSMGGALALLLAGQRSSAELASLSLLAPALALPTTTQTALRIMRRVGWPKVLGKGPSDLPADGQPPAFNAMPVAPLRSLVDLNEVLRDCRPHPTGPILVLHGTADRTIPPAVAARALRDLLGDRCKPEPIEGVGHLLTRTTKAQQVIERVVEFVGAAGQL